MWDTPTVTDRLSHRQRGAPHCGQRGSASRHREEVQVYDVQIAFILRKAKKGRRSEVSRGPAQNGSKIRRQPT